LADAVAALAAAQQDGGAGSSRRKVGEAGGGSMSNRPFPLTTTQPSTSSPPACAHDTQTHRTCRTASWACASTMCHTTYASPSTQVRPQLLTSCPAGLGSAAVLCVLVAVHVHVQRALTSARALPPSLVRRRARWPLVHGQGAGRRDEPDAPPRPAAAR
jgi:hypothetical protein